MAGLPRHQAAWQTLHPRCSAQGSVQTSPRVVCSLRCISTVAHAHRLATAAHPPNGAAPDPGPEGVSGAWIRGGSLAWIWRAYLEVPVDLWPGSGGRLPSLWPSCGLVSAGPLAACSRSARPRTAALWLPSTFGAPWMLAGRWCSYGTASRWGARVKMSQPLVYVSWGPAGGRLRGRRAGSCRSVQQPGSGWCPRRRSWGARSAAR